jgi:hypothetical protein
MIEKPAVHPDNDGHISTVFFPDFSHDMPDHLLCRAAMVGMFVTTAKDCVYDHPSPIHLERLEPFLFLVGGLYPVTKSSIIVVQDHGVKSQFNDIRIFDPQAPDEKPLQKSTEKINPCPGKSPEKSLDRMRRSHMFQMGFHSSGIAGIFFELIEITEPSAGSIDHKAKDLLEKLKNTNTFSVFADGAEKTLQPGKDFNGMEIFHKQSQTRSSGQAVMSFFNLTNLQFLF